MDLVLAENTLRLIALATDSVAIRRLALETLGETVEEANSKLMSTYWKEDIDAGLTWRTALDHHYAGFSNVIECSDELRVYALSIQGDETYYTAESEDAALRLAKKLRNISNYRVCIEQHKRRTHRWDRSHAVGKNHWRRKSPGTLGFIGALNQIHDVEQTDKHYITSSPWKT